MVGLEEHETEVAVIGAGLTGLWTAIRLKEMEPRTEVAVLERETADYGASGRNAGILSETIDHSHGLAVAHFGREEAARLATLGRSNVDDLTGFLATHGIDCALEQTGTLHVAFDSRQLAELGEDEACARSLGVSDLQILSAEATRARLRSPLYEGALFNPRGAILDPVLLVDGLVREAEGRGVRIFADTVMRDWKVARAWLFKELSPAMPPLRPSSSG